MASEERSAPSSVLNVLHRMSDAFVAVDRDWTVTYCNDRSQNVLGRPRQELVGQSFWQEFPEAVDTAFYDRCVAAMDDRTRQRFEASFEPIDARLSVQLYPTDHGLSMYFQDVSLRRRREEELTRYTTVVEAVSDGVLVIGESAEITMVNEAVERLFDVNRGRLIGNPLTELPSTTKLTPDDASRIATAVADVRDGDADERTIQIEVPGESGNRRVSELKLVPLPGSSKESVAGVIRDVTEREEHKRVVTSLHEATRHLFQNEDPADICATAVHTGADLLDLQISGIFLLDEERNRLEPIAATAGAHDMFGGLPSFTESEGIVWDVFRAGDGVYVEDVLEEDAVYEDDTPIRSELIVPIGDRGVLMAGDTHPGVFDETDLELAEILAANTDAALERARREQLLRNRADELQQQADRIETVIRLLSGPVGDALSDAKSAANGTAADRIEEVQGFVDDACHIAGDGDQPNARTAVSISNVAHAARASLSEPPSVRVIEDGRLRAMPDGIYRLFVALLRIASRSEDATAEVGIVREDDGTLGFYVEDDVPPLPPSDRMPPFDTIDPDQRTAIDLAVARQIVDRHDWSFDVRPTTQGMKIVIGDVTTLEPSD